MTRGEHYAALDQLRPGDTIVWTVGGQAEERRLSRAIPDGDEYILRWWNNDIDMLNASLLVRRIRQAVR